MTALRRWLLHRVAHWLHMQEGTVVTEWWQDRLWVGFRCSACGEVTDAHLARRERQP